jgi:hypothetical protein
MHQPVEPHGLERHHLRWFATGFDERDPATHRALMDGLDEIEPEGYAQVCEALADFDVETRLTQITAPVCTIAGSEDIATPPQFLHQIAVGVQSGCNVVLDGVAHLAPAEKPREVAAVIMSHIVRYADTASSQADSRRGHAWWGMAAPLGHHDYRLDPHRRVKTHRRLGESREAYEPEADTGSNETGRRLFDLKTKSHLTQMFSRLQ